MSSSIEEGCRRLLEVCADLQLHETVLIVCGPQTQSVANPLYQQALTLTSQVRLEVIEELQHPGQEPPPEVAARMLQSQVIFGLTSMSMAHSQARRRASAAGARYLSLPDYDLEVLAGPALLADFRGLSQLANNLAGVLTQGTQLRLTTALGTDLHCELGGRTGNAAPGWCWASGTLASPPDAEVNVAVLEDQSEGVVVVDGSVAYPGFGLLPEPLYITVTAGRVQTINGRESARLNELFDRDGLANTRVLAEFGIGLNPMAQLRGRMLEDEGCRGTIHLGIGSNSTIGGLNRVGFHLDFVVRRPTVTVDGICLVNDGSISEEWT